MLGGTNSSLRVLLSEGGCQLHPNPRYSLILASNPRRSLIFVSNLRCSLKSKQGRWLEPIHLTANWKRWPGWPQTANDGPRDATQDRAKGTGRHQCQDSRWAGSREDSYLRWRLQYFISWTKITRKRRDAFWHISDPNPQHRAAPPHSHFHIPRTKALFPHFFPQNVFLCRDIHSF